jgi:hypothetical protein
VKSRIVQESAVDLGDKTCIYCGASLAGLIASDRCPGCGKLAVDSLLGDNLRDADAPWVRTVLRGLLIMTIGYGLLIIDRLLTITQFAITQTLGPYHEVHGLFFYQRFIAFGGLTGLLVGLWMLTQREESDALIARRRGLAWVLRVAMILGVMAFLAPMTLPHLRLPQQTLTGVVWAGSIGAGIVHSLVWWHILRIIRRTPRYGVARLLKLAIWLSVPLFLLSNAPAIYALSQQFPPDRMLWITGAILPALLALHHAFAAYILILSDKAIRRTIGDWT